MGIAHWRRELCCGQLRLPGCKADTGLPDLDLRSSAKRWRTQPDHRRRADGRAIRSGVDRGPASCGDAWLRHRQRHAHEACERSPLAELAAEFGGRLIDVRVPPKDIPVGDRRQAHGTRLLTVGTDCAVGKKYTALAIDRALRERGRKSTFRATGQTGIMIAGQRHSDRRRRQRLRRRRRRAALSGQRSRSLGHRRRPRLAVSPELRGRHARPDPRLAARRAGAMSRPVAHADRMCRRLSDPAAQASHRALSSKRRD